MIFKMIGAAVVMIALGCTSPKEMIINHREGDLEVFEARVFTRSQIREIKRYNYYVSPSGEKVLHGCTTRWKEWSFSGSPQKGDTREYKHGIFVRNGTTFIEY